MASLDITTRIGCKNMCSYCPQKKIIAAYKSSEYIMSLDTFKKCIDKVPKSIKIIFAGMAEPFLNKDCIKMIQYANKKGFKLEVFTTGVGITKEDIKILETIPLAYFEFHLPDGSNNTQIKVDKYFLEIVKEIKKSKIPNIHYQIFGKVHPEVQKILNFEVEDLSRLLQNRAGNLEEGFKQKRITGKLICGETGKCLNSNVLLPNGDVILCCMDYGLKYKLGNLLNDSYESLFKSAVFRQLQNALDSKEGEILCRYCIHGKKPNSLKYNLKKYLEKKGVIKAVYSLTKYKPVKKVYLLMNRNKNTSSK